MILIRPSLLLVRAFPKAPARSDGDLVVGEDVQEKAFTFKPLEVTLKIPTLLLALFCTSNAFSQTIDRLKTDEEVLGFVRNLNEYNKKLYILPPKPVFGLQDYVSKIRKFGSMAYEKADFDNNGQTDLLFNGYSDDDRGNQTCRRRSLVVLSFGKDSFRIRELTNGHFIEFFTARKIRLGEKNCIVIFTIVQDNPESGKGLDRIDTLTYVADEFIEKTLPDNDSVTKIEFCASGGFFFQGLRLTMTSANSIMERDVSLRSKDTKIDNGGTFQAKIDALTSAKILELLKYIDIWHLKDDYEVGWTDDLTGVLTITYQNGKVKRIKDYGMIGTYGLAALQRTLIDLRDSQHWVKIAPARDEIIFCN
jgi:hypothetical protein